MPRSSLSKKAAVSRYSTEARVSRQQMEMCRSRTMYGPYTDGSSQLRVFTQNLFLLSTSSVTVGRQSRDESTERTLARLESVESQFESIRLRIPVRTGLSDAFMGNGILPVLFGWEGNRRSDVALAMRHRRCGISLYPTAG